MFANEELQDLAKELLKSKTPVADIFSKSRHNFGALVFHPVCALGPIAVLVVAAGGFYDHSFWRPETMMLAAAMFAIASSAFPAPKKADDDVLTEK